MMLVYILIIWLIFGCAAHFIDTAIGEFDNEYILIIANPIIFVAWLCIVILRTIILVIGIIAARLYVYQHGQFFWIDKKQMPLFAERERGVSGNIRRARLSDIRIRYIIFRYDKKYNKWMRKDL